MAVAGNDVVEIPPRRELVAISSISCGACRGAEDGEAVYPFYFLHVSHLIEIFDALPEMSWNTMNNEFSVEGKIDGDDAWITFSSGPFDDEEPQDVLDPKGGIRKRSRRRSEETLCRFTQ